MAVLRDIMDAAQQMHSPVRERFIQMLRDRPSGVKQSQELLMTLGTTSEELMAILLLKETKLPPKLSLAAGQKWMLFVSHIWSTGQDQVCTCC